MAKKPGRKAKVAKAKKAADVVPSHTEIGSEDLQNHHIEVPVQNLQCNINVPITESQPQGLPCELSSMAINSQENFNSINPDQISNTDAENQMKITDHANVLSLKVENPLAKNGIETEIKDRQEMGVGDRDTLQNAPNITTNDGQAISGARTELSTPLCKLEDLYSERVTSKYVNLESVKDMNTEVQKINHSVNLSLQNPGLPAASPRVSSNISGGRIENLMVETAYISLQNEDSQFSAPLSTEVKGLPADDMNEFNKVSTSNNKASHPSKSQTSEEILLEAQRIEILQSANNLDEVATKDKHKSSHIFQEDNNILDSRVKVEDRRKHNENSSPESTAPELDAQCYSYPSTEILKVENFPTFPKDFSTPNIDCTHNLAEKVSQAIWTESKEIAKMVTKEAVSQAYNSHGSGDLFDFPKHLLESASAELTCSATNLVEYMKKSHEPMKESIKETAVGNESNSTPHSSKSNITDQGQEGDSGKKQDSRETPVRNTLKISPDISSLISENVMNALEPDKIPNQSMGTGLDELTPQAKLNVKDDIKLSDEPNGLRPKITSKIRLTSHSLLPYAERDNSDSETCHFNSFVDDDEPINPRMPTTAHRAQDDVLGEKYTSKKNFDQTASCLTEDTKLVPSVNGIGIIEDCTCEVPKAQEPVEETNFKNVAPDDNNCSSYQIETGLGTMASRILQTDYAPNVSETEPKDADYERHNPKGVVRSGLTKFMAGNSMQIDEAHNQNKIPTTLSCSVSKDQVPESRIKETTTILTESKIQAVEQAPDMELVTMSKQSLDELHQRLNDMQKEIQNLTAVITSQSSNTNSMEASLVVSAPDQLYQSTPETTSNSTSDKATTVEIESANETKILSPTKRNGIWDMFWPFSNASSENRIKSISGTRNTSQNMLSQQVDRNRTNCLASPPVKYKVIGRVGAKHDRPINPR